MTDNIFIDTNLWVYLFSDDGEKKSSVSRLIRENFKNILTSSQILGELFNVLIKKEITDLDKARGIVFRIADDFPVLSIDKEVVKKAIDLKIRYGYSYWDSLVIASALNTQCNSIYTEDLHHNQLIEGNLRILNPFKK